MLQAIEGGAVLVLLSVFLAYLLAPRVADVQRRVRVGRRRRPVSRAGALLILYAAVLVPIGIAWRRIEPAASHWVHLTAPAAVDRLFADNLQPFERAVARVPLPQNLRVAVLGSGDRTIRYVEREARRTLGELISAADQVVWLLVTPALAFLLLTGAPGFQRSTLRVLPHGHLQWRGEEYLRDVNSALAGYVRAQSAAGVLVGALCVAGFVVLGIPSAISLGVAAGILELVPAIGPLVVVLLTAAQAGNRALAAVLFLAALRVVQDYVIYPRLIRKGMHLSTAAVIVTVWFGAALAGAAGVILAIPVAGFLSVSWRHWREYREIERLVRAKAAARD